MLHKVFLSGMILGFLTALHVPVEAEELLWCRFNTPPISIATEPFKDMGYSDRFLSELFEAMDGYTHIIVDCNISRTLDLIAGLPNVCNAALLHNEERDGFIHYSKPVMGLMPNRLIVLEENAHLLTSFMTEKGMNLGRILRESSLRVGLIRNRSYGCFIDKHLKEVWESRHIHWLGHSELGVRQLLGGRIDALVAYVQEAVYFNRIHDEDRTIRSYAIQGEELVDMFIGCSDTEQGRKAMRVIDRLLGNGLRGTYLRHYLEWLDPEARREVVAHVAGWPGVPVGVATNKAAPEGGLVY